MCVIMTKPKQTKMVDEATIRNMWEENPDGAGFMYELNGKVFIEKGFMKLKHLLRAYNALQQRLDKRRMTIDDISFIMHFRITTHGGTNPENTHPFPIHFNAKQLASTDTICNLGMAHNGIISSVTVPYASKLSDTATYIKQVLVPLYNTNRTFYKDKNLSRLVENTIGLSRLAFLNDKGDIVHLGYGWTKDYRDEFQHITYSNDNHFYDELYGYTKAWKKYKSYLDTYEDVDYEKEYAKYTKSSYYFTNTKKTLLDVIGYEAYDAIADDVIQDEIERKYLNMLRKHVMNAESNGEYDIIKHRFMPTVEVKPVPMDSNIVSYVPFMSLDKNYRVSYEFNRDIHVDELNKVYSDLTYYVDVDGNIYTNFHDHITKTQNITASKLYCRLVEVLSTPLNSYVTTKFIGADDIEGEYETIELDISTYYYDKLFKNDKERDVA